MTRRLVQLSVLFALALPAIAVAEGQGARRDTPNRARRGFAAGPLPKAAGPDAQPPVYLLYHNFASGIPQHNMWVATSNDGGMTFGPPVPTAQPGSDAYQDLQC